MKTNVSKGLVPTSTVDKNQRRVTLCLPGTQTVPVLSSPSPPASLIPLGSSLPLEEEVAKMDERQPVKAAVSKNAMSVEQHSPSHQVPAVPLKPKPAHPMQAIPHVSRGMDLMISTLPVPGGNNSESPRSLEVIPLAPHGIKSMSPMHRDGIDTEAAHMQPHTSYPNAPICCHASSSRSLSLMMDIPAQHGQDVVSGSDNMSNKYSLAFCEAVSQQPFQINERRSPEHSEALMELVS